MYVKFVIRNIPAYQDHHGIDHPAAFDVSLTDNLGLKWDGGTFKTREEAVAEGERRTKR